MSTPPEPQNPYAPHTPPAPGPYAPQPPAPQGPYAPQPPTPQGPYAPYGGQQQPAPPYGAPHPQQPYGWGAPPMAPPPKKRRVGLVVGIVGGVVGVVVAIVVALALIGQAAGGGFPEAKFRLTLPETLADGRFELAQDLSDTEGQKVLDGADGAWDAKVTDAVVGQYNQGGDDTKGVLVISGMYGRFKNTDEARDNMLEGVSTADGVTVAVGPKDFTQGGSPTVSCQVVTQKQLGTTLTYPVCGWADGNTGAAVAPIAAEAATQDPSDVDLAFYAKFTLQVRSEMMKPIG